MPRKRDIHSTIQNANEEKMRELVQTRAPDLLKHCRLCDSCEGKRQQALDRRLDEMPTERQEALIAAARGVCKRIAERVSG